MTIKEKLSGVFIPAVTPFTDGEIQYKKLEENIKRYNKTPITGYLVLGSNGENKSLTNDEKLEVLGLFTSKKEDKVIMAGTGCESTKETIELSSEAVKLGADFISVLTPSYFARQINDDVLKDYYTEIADNISSPLLLYNAPGFAGGVKISPLTVSNLAIHPNIVGMKDSSSDGLMGYISATKNIEDFHIISGSINFFLTGLFYGATGGILSIANAFPELCCDLYNNFIDNDIDAAIKLHFKLFELNSKVSGAGGVSSVKAAITLAGFFGGEPRKPLRPLTDAGIKKLHDYLKEKKFI